MDGMSFDVLTMKRLRHTPGLVSLQGMMNLPGAFAFLASTAEGLIVGRDPLGQKPLYYGKDSNERIAFASLRRALETNGFETTVAVPPGKIFTPSGGSLSTVFDASLSKPMEVNLTEYSAQAELIKLLEESVSETFQKGAAVAFSGGLDSSLIAHIANSLGLEPMLVTVGLKGHPELAYTQGAAEKIGLNLNVREFTESEILDCVQKVVKIIESDDPVLVGISIPLYFACETAKGLGARTIVMGQLSDELFGGYGRFEDLTLKNQFDKVRSEIWKSVLDASVKDFDTGDKLAASYDLELRCPFAYLPLVHYALKLPVTLKLNISDSGVTRKFILRKAAEKMGLPWDVVNRPKKAIQYSSGVQKVLLSQAKKRGLTISSLIRSMAT
jgi:asparagine synthase (glutamine-hydrolysing)